MIESARARMHGETGGDGFAVWPENWETLVFFCSLKRQWKWVGGFGFARRTGLDWSAVEAIMRIKRMKDRAEMLHKLQIMEEAALAVWDEK